MPYIDKDKLIKELSTMYKSPTSAEDFMTVGYDHAIADTVVTVHKQPTVDAVKVVRCGECKHSYDAIGGTFCSYGTCVDCMVDVDFFCKNGERRAENADNSQI